MCAEELYGTKTWLWSPLTGEPFPGELAQRLNPGGEQVIAHNARFDQGIWEYNVDRHNLPMLKVEQWYCSMAQMRINALPAALDKATRALDTKFRKQKDEGRRLIQKYCIPIKGTSQFNQLDVRSLASMAAYCMDDVRATKELVLSTRMMNDKEQAEWQDNERINDAGIRIDLPLAKIVQQYGKRELDEIGAELTELTHGEITTPGQIQRIKAAVLPKLCEAAERITVVYKGNVRKNSFGRDILEQLLDRVEEFEIDPQTEQILRCRLNASQATSVSKFKRMIDMADPYDRRVRGAFIYGGAATLRYTSRGLQLHNFRRDAMSIPDTENMRRMLLTGAQLASQGLLTTLGKLLRPTLIPADGHVFVVGDWSGIENRGAPWLSGDSRAERKLDQFRAHDADPTGKDTYQIAAADAGMPDNRQIGKVIELSLQFGGSNRAFRNMGKNYGVYLKEAEETRIIQNWRRKNSWCPRYWKKLEVAAKRSIRSPGVTHHAGHVSYTCDDGYLRCRLPSGQVITYPQVKLEEGEITALKANWTPAADSTEWPRFKLYGGLLLENITQATCACLLREAISRLSHVVMHVHDEIILEVPESEAYYHQSHLQTHMEIANDWAQGLPLKAEPQILTRYGK